MGSNPSLYPLAEKILIFNIINITRISFSKVSKSLQTLRSFCLIIGEAKTITFKKAKSSINML